MEIKPCQGLEKLFQWKWVEWCRKKNGAGRRAKNQRNYFLIWKSFFGVPVCLLVLEVIRIFQITNKDTKTNYCNPLVKCPCTALPQILPAKAKDCCWPNDLRRAIWRCFDFLNFKADFERTCSSTDTTDLKIFCLDGYMSTFAKKSFCGKWRITLTLQIKLWLKRQGQHMYKQKRSCWKCTVSNLNTGQEKQRNKVKSNKETKLNQTKKQSWIKQRKKETKLNERQSLSCSCSNPDFTGLV